VFFTTSAPILAGPSQSREGVAGDSRGNSPNGNIIGLHIK